MNINYNGKATNKHVCPYCEKTFEDTLPQHIPTCYKIHFQDNSIVKRPQRGTYMNFEHHKNKLRTFMFYADTETTLTKTDDYQRFISVSLTVVVSILFVF